MNEEMPYNSLFKALEWQQADPLTAIKRREYRRVGISTFKWDGMPEKIDALQIEKILFDSGQVAIVNSRKFGWILTKCLVSECNKWGDPITIKTQYADDTLDEEFKVNGDDAILILDTSTYGVLRRDSIEYWLRKYSDVQKIIDMQVINQSTPLLALTSELSEVDKLTHVILDVTTGAKALVIPPDIFDRLQVLNLNAPFNVDKLVALQDKYLANAKEPLGIDSVATFGKKERLIVDEQESNDDILGLFLQDCKNSREKAVEKINRLMDLNVTVDVITPSRVTAETDTGDEMTSGDVA